MLVRILKLLLLFLTISIGFSFVSKRKKKLPDICLSIEEKKLFELVNNYRIDKGLKEIPLSISLTFVAQTHAKDLHNNRPAASDSCNMHSWSKTRDWSDCCYDKSHRQKECMWDKPKQLTNYNGKGFELSHGFGQLKEFKGDTVTAESALKGWINSVHHNNVLINKKVWSKIEWNAMGIGIHKDFICLCLGEEKDTEEKKFIECN